MRNSHAAFDKLVKQEIIVDRSLNSFLVPFILERKVRQNFIINCVKKIKTRRMLLRLWWYGGVVRKISKVFPGHPSLSFIFILAITEGLEKQAQGNDKDDRNALGYIQDFFKYISLDDKQIFLNKIKYLLPRRQRYKLSFNSIIKMLWHARCDAAHGREFWSFLLPSHNTIKSGIGYNTSGQLGIPNNKFRTTIQANITIDEISNIIIRTGINRIEAELLR